MSLVTLGSPFAPISSNPVKKAEIKSFAPLFSSFGNYDPSLQTIIISCSTVADREIIKEIEQATSKKADLFECLVSKSIQSYYVFSSSNDLPSWILKRLEENKMLYLPAAIHRENQSLHYFLPDILVLNFKHSSTEDFLQNWTQKKNLSCHLPTRTFFRIKKIMVDVPSERPIYDFFDAIQKDREIESIQPHEFFLS